MWFFSMPSFVMSCVLAVVYVACFVLHVANRKQEDNVVEIEAINQKTEMRQQQAVALSSQNAIEVHENFYNDKSQTFIWLDFVDRFDVPNSRLTPLRASPFSIFNSEIWREHHPRPPPVC